MSSSRAGGGSIPAGIPANARKTIQSLKEVVESSEDEIYATLKECNMDPDETVQRLLKQDPFLEVKRKRDKKKEGNKEALDIRARPASGGGHGRGGRGGMSDRGPGKGSSMPRQNANEFNGGRGKPFASRENGSVNTSTRAANSFGGSSSSTPPSYVQPKTFSPGLGSSAATAPTTAASPGLQNGSSGFSRPTSVPSSTWGASASGHATMADIVKANGAPPPTTVATPTLPSTNTPVGTLAATSVTQQYISSPTSASPSVSSGVYSSSTDPVLHPSLDPRAPGTPGAIKREVGTVGNQRPKGDWSTSPLNIDAISGSAPQSLQISQTSLPSSVGSSSLDADTQITRPSSPPASAPPPGLQERPASHPVSVDSAVGNQPRQGGGASSNGPPASRSVVAGGPFNTRPVYQPQQHPVGTQKVSAPGLEWKPKPVVQSSANLGGVNTPTQLEVVRSSPPSSGPVETGLLSTATSKMQGISLHDDQPVIIPNHLQVPEAERTHLSFGSFGAGFGTSFPTSYVSEDSGKATVAISESIPVIESPVEQATTSSAVSQAPASMNQTYVHQAISVPEDNLVSSIDTTAVSMPAPTVSQPELLKPDPVVHQGHHYPYLPAAPSYGGFNLMPHIPGGQYAYETAETQQPQDVSRLPSVMQPYTDPTTSYYTPAFRPGADGDTRYPPFVTSNASSKYNGNLGLINLAGQSLPSSQESGNAILPSSVPTAQTTQTGNAQTVPTMPQQPLPLHYTGQPGGAPLAHHFTNMFGYQYLPPSFAYMHTHAPYQHNYTTNSGYPQPPAGSSYPPAASSYPPGGGATVKYQISPYKPGTATANAPHSAAAAGYGGYATTPSGYAANPTVSAGSATGYDDVGVPQYKDNNLYIPTQQGEGSTVWIQAQLSRDMAAAGMQTSSYYNLAGQGQHTAYGHTQQPTHGHAHPGAYASVYHPSQSGPAPTAHQLLQQPQALGAQGAGGAQGGGYQQPQRTQQTWPSNY